MDFLFQPLDLTLDDLHSLNQGHGRFKVAVEPYWGFRGPLLQSPTNRKPYVDFLFQPLDLTLDDLDSLNQGHGRLKVAVEA